MNIIIWDLFQIGNNTKLRFIFIWENLLIENYLKKMAKWQSGKVNFRDGNGKVAKWQSRILN